MRTYPAVTAPHSVYRPDPHARSLPYLAGETVGGYCTGCGATVPVRYLLYTPAVIGARGITASFQWKVCGACLSLTSHRPQW